MSTSENFSINTSKYFSVKKGFALPLIIFLAMILGLVAYPIIGLTIKHPPKLNPPTPATKSTPAPDETVYTDKGSANWKTYTNTQYGFLIKYPETLVPTVLPNASESFAIPISENDRIEIQTIGSIDPFDLNDEMNSDLQRRGDTKKINFHSKPAVLTRYTVKQAPKPPVIPYMAVFVYLEDKKSKIVLEYYGDGSNELLFNQILSTFRFI